MTEDAPETSLEPLSDEDKLFLAPLLARRASLLGELAHRGMIREPRSDEEAVIWQRLQEFFPGFPNFEDGDGWTTVDLPSRD